MQYLFSYIKHLFKSRRRHGVHSPFVYTLSDQVLKQYPKWTYFISLEKRKDFAARQWEDLLQYIRNQQLVNIHTENIKIIQARDIKEPGDMPEFEQMLVLLRPYEHQGLSRDSKKNWKALFPDCSFIDTWHLWLIIRDKSFVQPVYYRLY